MQFKPFDAEALIDVTAAMLQLPIAPEYREGVRQHIKTAAKMAALVEQVKLTDDTDPGPVYRP